MVLLGGIYEFQNMQLQLQLLYNNKHMSFNAKGDFESVSYLV